LTPYSGALAPEISVVSVRRNKTPAPLICRIRDAISALTPAPLDAEGRQ
jgi:hypothetical protein